MLLKIRLVLVPVHVLEHASVLHIMAVQHIIASHKISLALKIQVNGPRNILLAVKIMIQIEIVVLSLNNGVINVGIRHPDPSDGIRILLHQLFKIDGRYIGLCLRFLCPGLCHCFRGRLRSSLPGQFGQPLIFLPGPLVLYPAVDAHGTAYQHHGQ